MQNKPPYSDNLHGACTVYAVANLLHFLSGAEGLVNTYPSKSNGYLLSHIQDLVQYASERELHNYILKYDAKYPIPQGELLNLYPFWQLSEQTSDLDKELYTLLLFHVMREGGAMHVVSAYMNLDNFALVVIDSQGEGSVELMEIAQLFKRFKVFGCCMMLLETNTGYIPYLVEKETLKAIL